MTHLTVDEIIEFVSLNKLNREALKLSATVNGHIRKCEKCLNRVNAFQMIYDEFSRCNTNTDFKKYLAENKSFNAGAEANVKYSTDGIDGF